MRTSLHVAFIPFLLVAVGCNDADRISKEMQATVDRNVKLLHDAAIETKNAMPGERERDLLWKAIGGTPEEQKQSKDFIARLYQIPAEDFANYQVTVWVTGLTSGESLRTQAFLAPVPAKEVVEQALIGRRQNTSLLGSIATTAPTPAEAQQMVEKQIKAAIESFFGKVSVSTRCSVTIAASGILPDAFQVSQCDDAGGLSFRMPRVATGGGKGGAWEVASDMQARRDEGIKSLLAAIIPVAATRVNQQSSIQLEWSPQGEDNLVVLINEQDYQKYRDRLLKPDTEPGAVRIKAKLHKRGDPTKSFRLQGDRYFVPEDFALSERRVEDASTKDVYRWAFIDVAGTAGLNAQQLQLQAAFKKAYADLEATLKEPTKRSK